MLGRMENKRKMKQEIKFGRFKFEKVFRFPSDVEKFILYMQTKLELDEKKITHCFCGNSKIGHLRIDINKNVRPDLCASVLDLPNILGENSQDFILADPPWVIDYGSRRKFSYALRDILKPNGILIINSPWSPWCEGLIELEVWKVEQTYNSYRDLVDFWIFKKENLV